jgi:hypothetical protein
MAITYTCTIIDDTRTYADADDAVLALSDDLESLLTEHWEHTTRPGNAEAENSVRAVIADVDGGAVQRALETSGAWEWTYPAPEGGQALTYRLTRS